MVDEHDGGELVVGRHPDADDHVVAVAEHVDHLDRARDRGVAQAVQPGWQPVAAGGDHLPQVRAGQRIGCQLGDDREDGGGLGPHGAAEGPSRSSMVDRAGSLRANGSASRGSTSDIIVLTSSSRGSGPGVCSARRTVAISSGSRGPWWRRRGAGPGRSPGPGALGVRARPCGCGVPSSPCRHATTRAALSRTPPRPPPQRPCPITVGGRRRRPARSWP